MHKPKKVKKFALNSKLQNIQIRRNDVQINHMCLSCFITPAQHKEFFGVFRLILKMGRK